MRKFPLPPILEEISSVIGRDKTITLVGKLPRSAQIKRDGRTRQRIYLYIPKTLTPEHKLIELLGYEDALKMVDAFAGEIICVPSLKNMHTHFLHHSIRAQYGAGVNIEILVIIFNMTRKNIQRILF